MLSRIVELLPAPSVEFIVQEFVGRGVAVAKHKYGCRVLQRCIEHCTESQMCALGEELTRETEALCRHTFGNFVMQSLLEHGPVSCRRTVVRIMLQCLPQMRKHRIAHRVVQQAASCCGEEDRLALASIDRKSVV